MLVEPPNIFVDAPTPELLLKPAAGEANELDELNPPDEGAPNAEVLVAGAGVP
jgi:hypothetical protein